MVIENKVTNLHTYLNEGGCAGFQPIHINVDNIRIKTAATNISATFNVIKTYRNSSNSIF